MGVKREREIGRKMGKKEKEETREGEKKRE